jgi:hypothetical protein
MRAGELLGLVSALLVCACGGTSTGSQPQGACEGSDVLVRGTVIRDLTTPFQYVGATELGPDSSARIALLSNPSFGGDGASKLVAEEVSKPAPALPFDFCVTGARESVADASLEYAVEVHVEQHAGQTTIGDLTDELLEVVKPPGATITLRVTGLEGCTDPGAGGFCVMP